VRLAADVLTRAGVSTFGLVEPATSRPTPAPAGFSAGTSDRLRLFSDYDLRITTFRANASSQTPSP